MKQSLWNITLASLITLAAYIVLGVIWGAVLNEIEEPTLHLLLLASMTSAAFGYFLLFTSKIRFAVGEKEVIADYRDSRYTSFRKDFILLLRRERKMLICMTGVVFLCFALNTADALLFDKKLLSLPTFIFAPMCLFDTVTDLPFVGYAVNAVYNAAVYLLFLLIYRKKVYNYWMNKKV